MAGRTAKRRRLQWLPALLDAGEFDPTVINGGIINAYGTNARMGGGNWMVVEADESDGTFIKLPADVAIITNIDPEHLDHYGDFAGVRAAFRQFVDNVPFYGFAVMCLDHPEVQTMIGTIEDRRVVTYGTNPQADVRFTDVAMGGGKSKFSVTIRDRRTGQITELSDLVLPMPGLHNVSNATAAIAVASQLGVGPEALRKGISAFGGVKRRFTHTGTVDGVQIFDDYAHHPVEIRAVLHAARESTSGKVIAVMQPHRYSRLQSLFDDFSNCFNDADAVIVAPVYAAGELPLEGALHTDLVSGMKTRGHRHVRAIDGPEELPA